MSAFFIAFISTLFAEMGDKTQLVTLTLSTRYPPLRVLTGSLSALAAITGIAVLLGDYLANLLPETTTLLASGIFFLIIGVCLFLQKVDDEESVETPHSRVTLQTFIMVFLAELGDKTQLTAIALSAAYGQPLAVFFGAMAGQTINHSLAAFLGSRLLSRLPDKLIKTGSALLFIIFGLLFIISVLR
ncbi:MAG: TMEM165/GDT1 family protein [Firmicutes bacterium]|nr:TMEM165/GDT1 family protein [Bacillota bacterium]